MKHLIIVAMVIATALEIHSLLQFRNLGILVVAVLIGVNSALDLRDRRRGLRGFLEQQGAHE